MVKDPIRIKNPVISWKDVEIFRLVKNRLPDQEGDILTKEILQEFINEFKADPRYVFLIFYASQKLWEEKEKNNAINKN